jgi:hypothetical protein
MCALEGEIGSLWEVIAASGAKVKEDLISIEWRGNDGQRGLQEREAMPDVRNRAGQPEAELEAVVKESGRCVLAGAEMRRVKEQLGAEVCGLKLWIEVLEQDDRGRMQYVHRVRKCASHQTIWLS